MQLITSIKNINKDSIFAAIGCFDGIHTGHKKLLSMLLKAAKEKNKKTAVITFSPLPFQYFKQRENSVILSQEEKIRKLKAIGIDQMWRLPFNDNFLKNSKEDFFNILQKNIRCEHLFVGEDFRFGYKGEGNVSFLKENTNNSFSLTVMNDFLLSGKRVSSTEIRNNILSGDFNIVNKMLGYEYFYEETVSHGEKKGRELGANTANLNINSDIIMPSGVFFAKAEYSLDSGGFSKKYPVICNIGRKPTFKKDIRILEAHILDKNINLYKKRLRVYPIKKLREEKSFKNIESLIKQIKIDIDLAKDFFKYNNL